MTGSPSRQPTTELGVKLAVDRISHSYGAVEVLHNVAFEVGPGEIVALLGPSGCGKTTILRIIAGFIRQSKGLVVVDGASIDGLPPHRRHMGLVFQNYALFPHLTVRENIGYGLVAQGHKRPDIRRRADEILELIRLSESASRLPRELSGGQQQRVATGRALAVKPRLMLLDEPFGALDKNLRLDMQIEFLRIQRQFGITTIIVTHDQEEALSISDRVVVLNHGRIEQIGTPTEVYDRPASLFVNSFVGTTNVLSGGVIGSSPGRATVRLPGENDLLIATDVAAAPGTQVVVTARPEHILLTDKLGDAAFQGTVEAVLPVGPTLLYEIALADGSQIKVSESRHSGRRTFPRGADVFVMLPPDNCQIFTDSTQPPL